MDNRNYFIFLFESIPDYKKIVLLMFLIKYDNDLLTECGYSKNDIKRLNKEFINILLKQKEDYLDYIKNEEESVIERILNKQMEQNFAILFEDLRQERYLIL